MFLSRTELDEIVKGDILTTDRDNRYKVTKATKRKIRCYNVVFDRADGCMYPIGRRTPEFIKKVEHKALGDENAATN